jgi:hypothetical protein
VVLDIRELEVNGGPLTLESLRKVVALDIREFEVCSGLLHWGGRGKRHPLTLERFR